jgi:hypothetical protein
MDDVQKDKRNEPDPFILGYWKPKIGLKSGIRMVNEQMQTILQEGESPKAVRPISVMPPKSARGQVDRVAKNVILEP